MSIDLSTLKRKQKIQTEQIGARLDRESKERLDEICKKEKISVSALVYKLVRDFIAAYKD